MAMTLEPCPFCGTADMDTCNPDGVFPDGGPHGYFVARCGNPDCAAEVSKQGREETIAAWNRRAHLTQPAQAVDVGAAEVVLDALDKAAESEWGRHIAWHGFRDEEARIAVVRTALAALAPAKVYVCTGCDREANDPGADLAAIQSAGGMTCCPERNIVERPTRALAAEKAGWRPGKYSREQVDACAKRMKFYGHDIATAILTEYANALPASPTPDKEG